MDRRLAAELESLDPEAAQLFRDANDDRDRGDHDEASRLYGKVHEMVPSFVHALRRQCGEELACGRRDAAVALCRSAVQQQVSADNLAALARALVAGTEPSPRHMEEKAEARDLVVQAVELEPGDLFVSITMCEVAVARSDGKLLRDCVQHLVDRFPSETATYYFQMVQAAQEGRLDDATRYLEEARRTGGLPDEMYRYAQEYLRRSHTNLPALAEIGLFAGAAWLGTMGILLAAGLVLSRLALRAAQQTSVGPEGAVTGMSARLRRIYRVVLWLCCGYYYSSIPVVALLVLATGGGVIYAMFWIGQVPLKLVVIAGLLTLYTLAAIARSLFVRSMKAEPGERLDLGLHAGLRALLDQVADKVGTRPADSVYVTPGVQVAVMERGGGLVASARGRTERCLILGAAALEGFRIGPFKAVLAHEYGHFSNRDTAGGGFALAVRRSLLTMAGGIARGGAAAWFNPAWLFVIGFYRVFLVISQGASRLQEVLADRWAALSYGARAFEEGLRHVVVRSVRFDAHVGTTLDEVIKAKRPLENLYAYRTAAPPLERDLETRVRQALEAKPSPYDSHPAPADRIAWVKAIAADGAGAAVEDDEEVWTLFPDREAIERAMTAVVRKNIMLLHGIQIAGSMPPDLPGR